jgi:putative oxidoreductase
MTTREGALWSWVDLAARVLMALIFLLSGIGKLGAYSATAAYMAAAGIPGALLPLVIATEILGALAVMLGWKTRIAAFLVAGFSVLSAIGFHRNLADQMEMIQFLKDISIAGGFLLLVANGPGRLSIDGHSAA